MSKYYLHLEGSVYEVPEQLMNRVTPSEQSFDRWMNEVKACPRYPWRGERLKEGARLNAGQVSIMQRGSILHDYYAYPVSAAAKGEDKSKMPLIPIGISSDYEKGYRQALIDIQGQPPAQHTGSGQRLFTEKEMEGFAEFIEQKDYTRGAFTTWGKTNDLRETRLTTSDLLNEFIKTLNK